MREISIKNRIGIVNNGVSINNIRVNTRDVVSHSDIEIIKSIIKEIEPNIKYDIRYSPAAEGSHIVTTIIDFAASSVTKENIDYMFYLISNILPNYAIYKASKEGTKISNIKVEQEKQKLRKDIASADKEEFILQCLKDSYVVKKHINSKYDAMIYDAEVEFNEATIEFDGKKVKYKENRSDFIKRKTILKPISSSISFAGIIKINSLFVDGDNKWSGIFYGDDIVHDNILILKNNSSIKFKVRDTYFKKSIIQNDSLSIDLIISVIIEAKIEITDETKVKDFIILEVCSDEEDAEMLLRKYKDGNQLSFDF